MKRQRRARAVERLRRLLSAARYGRRAPDPTDFTYGSPTPIMAGGCIFARAVLLMMLFFFTSFVSRPCKFRDLNARLLGSPFRNDDNYFTLYGLENRFEC